MLATKARGSHGRMDGQRATVRTTNGGEITGRCYTRGATYGITVYPDGGTRPFEISADRVLYVTRLGGR